MVYFSFMGGVGDLEDSVEEVFEVGFVRGVEVLEEARGWVR